MGGEERHRHDLEEGEEQQRALVPAGEEDGGGEERPVDEDQRREERRFEAREPSSGELGRADDEQVGERHHEGDAPLPEQGRQGEHRGGQADPHQLEHGQAVMDRRLDVVAERDRGHLKSRKSRCASIGARAIRGSRRSTRLWTTRKASTAPARVRRSPYERAVRRARLL